MLVINQRIMALASLHGGNAMKAPTPESTLFFSRFLQLLSKDSFLLARTFNRVVVGHADKDSDAINSMVAILSHHGLIYRLVGLLVNEDLQSSAGATFLRENARSTNVVQGLLRCHEKEMIDGELGEFVVDLVKKVSKGKFESSPENLLDLAKEALAIIYRCEVPGPIKRVSSKIADACTDANYRVNDLDPSSFTVGSVLFLHMLCPALVSPKKFTAVRRYLRAKEKDNLPPECTRVLVTIVKLIQALANGTTEFANPSMAVYNDFLSTESEGYARFCAEVVANPGIEDALLPEDKLMRRWKVLFRFAKRRSEEVVAKADPESAQTVSRLLKAAIDSVGSSRAALASEEAFALPRQRSNSLCPDLKSRSCDASPVMVRRRGSNVDVRQQPGDHSPKLRHTGKLSRTRSPGVTFRVIGIGRSSRRKSMSVSPTLEVKDRRQKKASLGGLYG